MEKITERNKDNQRGAATPPPFINNQIHKIMTNLQTIDNGMQNGLRDLIIEKFGSIANCEKEFTRVTGIKLNAGIFKKWLECSKPKEVNKYAYEELMRFLHYKLDVRFPNGLFKGAVTNNGTPLYVWSEGMTRLRKAIKSKTYWGGYEPFVQAVNTRYNSHCDDSTTRKWIELNAKPMKKSELNYRSAIAYLKHCGCEFPDGTFGSVIVPNKLTPPANEPIAPKCNKPSGMLFLGFDDEPTADTPLIEILNKTQMETVDFINRAFDKLRNMTR